MKNTFVGAVNPFRRRHILKNGGNEQDVISSDDMFNSLSNKNKKGICLANLPIF